MGIRWKLNRGTLSGWFGTFIHLQGWKAYAQTNKLSIYKLEEILGIEDGTLSLVVNDKLVCAHPMLILNLFIQQHPLL